MMHQIPKGWLRMTYEKEDLEDLLWVMISNARAPLALAPEYHEKARDAIQPALPCGTAGPECGHSKSIARTPPNQASTIGFPVSISNPDREGALWRARGRVYDLMPKVLVDLTLWNDRPRTSWHVRVHTPAYHHTWTSATEAFARVRLAEWVANQRRVPNSPFNPRVQPPYPNLDPNIKDNELLEACKRYVEQRNPSHTVFDSLIALLRDDGAMVTMIVEYQEPKRPLKRHRP